MYFVEAMQSTVDPSDCLPYASRCDSKIVILDVGSMYLKCGLAGEALPRCIIPNLVDSSRAGILDLAQEISPFKSMKRSISCMKVRH